MENINNSEVGVFHIAIKSGTGTETFTQSLHEDLLVKGVRSAVCWLPHYAEFLPWFTPAPRVPEWVNVVHVNTWLHPRFLPPGIPVVSTFHSVVHDPVMSKYKGWLQVIYHNFWIKYCERRVISRSKKITAVSKYTAEQAKSIFNLRRLDVVCNSVDTFVFSPSSSKRSARSTIEILFVGKPSIRKGVDLMMQLMSKLDGRFRLTITADNDDLKCNAQKNICWRGRVNDTAELVELYRQSDIFILPSRLEGMSLSLLEAQACGLPCVVGRSSSMSEVVSDCVNGYVCDLNSIDEFLAAVIRLGNSSELREKMGEAARSNIVNNFSREKMVNAYVSLYKEISSK